LAVRPLLEELETRALPNAAPIQQLGVDIRLDMNDIQADVQSVTSSLGTKVSATVKTDIINLNTDVAKVKADMAAGASATADINLTITATAQLRTDLGSNLPASVGRHLHDTERDLHDLSHDLSLVGRGIRHDLTDIQADAGKLSQALGGSTRPGVQADLTALNAAIMAVATDLAAGKSAAHDLTGVSNALASLTTDLGNTATRQVQHELRDLRRDTHDLQADLNRIMKVVNHSASDLQSDTTKLTQTLGSGVSAMVKTDLTALGKDLTAVANDLKTGTAASADVGKVITDLAALTTDVGTSVSPTVLHELRDLRNDAQELAVELLAL
jgi:hypothetical protein